MRLAKANQRGTYYTLIYDHQDIEAHPFNLTPPSFINSGATKDVETKIKKLNKT